jgi:hypothetical protein
VGCAAAHIISMSQSHVCNCCAAGKETQLCAPCETSADCGPLGSYTDLPDVLGGLPKGHILSAHYPTVCHHRACVPLQVPSKDGFCRALRDAQQHTAKPTHKQLPAHEQQQRQPAFSLSSLAQKIYRPVAGQLSSKKAQQTVPRRQLSERQPRVYNALAPAPSYQRQQQQGAAAQPQGAVNSAQPAESGAGSAPLVGGGQLSQNVGNGARFGSQGYQVYTPASPQRLSSQEATATAANNPSLVDAGTSSDVASNAQQQLRAAPTAQAGTRCAQQAFHFLC